MTNFERAKEMIKQWYCHALSKQAQRERTQYWLGFAFALVEFGIITRAQYADLIKETKT